MLWPGKEKLLGPRLETAEPVDRKTRAGSPAAQPQGIKLATHVALLKETGA
jgi:hypothetical protein